MSLFSTYSSANKVESRALAIRYSVQLVNYTYYQVTRTADKEYAYSSMTRSAAESCALAKIAQYTRNYYKLSSEKDEDAVPLVYSYKDCKAQVSKVHRDGDAWAVNISVSEEDIRAVKLPPSDPASLFSSENVRDYDETAGVLYSITIQSSTGSVSGGTTTIRYSQNNIPDFDPGGVVVQYKQTESQQDWETSQGDVSGTQIICYRFLPYVRLIYGSLASPVVQTTSS